MGLRNGRFQFCGLVLVLACATQLAGVTAVGAAWRTVSFELALPIERTPKAPPEWQTTQYSQATREDVEVSARRLLASARKGRPFTTPRGVRRFPLEVNGEACGTLWEDVDLGTVGLGAHWESQSGMRIELVRDGRVVGMMWLEHVR